MEYKNLFKYVNEFEDVIELHDVNGMLGITAFDHENNKVVSTCIVTFQHMKEMRDTLTKFIKTLEIKCDIK